ncbi:hypothetical protein [Aestuariispira insulae]|uniref:Uncharacterized protein n=1 Tax=Aestuariispira insulae TaxID=1461337 RepID=A0A3D9HRA5_9PROT|nr:hypothetical protein [Aestuariispira insulae]RED51416.1 hypothetical protein DFP90_103216 [Aestuariispira insulae]
MVPMKKTGHPQSAAPEISSEIGPSQLADTVKKVMDLMESRLSDQIAATRGNISGYDMHTLLNDMKSMKDPELQGIIKKGWADIHDTVESVIWDEDRTHPLYRMIVHRFAPLLPARGDTPIPGQHLSRAIIRPLHAALEQMVGPGVLKDSEAECRDIVLEKREDAGRKFHWDQIYSDPKTNHMADDILVRAAHYFLDCPKRRNWMISVISNGIAHLTDKSQQDGDWFFGDWEFHMLTGALYSPLFEQLAEEEGDLVLRYGEDGAGLLRNLQTALAEDRRQFA